MADIYEWVRFRTLHAHGPGMWQWEEICFDDKDDRQKALKDFLDEAKDEHDTGTDKYRGVEGDFMAPTMEYLNKLIRREEDRIDAIKLDIIRHKQQQENMK